MDTLRKATCPRSRQRKPLHTNRTEPIFAHILAILGNGQAPSINQLKPLITADTAAIPSILLTIQDDHHAQIIHQREAIGAAHAHPVTHRYAVWDVYLAAAGSQSVQEVGLDALDADAPVRDSASRLHAVAVGGKGQQGRAGKA